MLSDTGYATGMFGKWHLGDAEGRYPTDQGFDEWYGIPNSSDQAFWPDSDSFQSDAGVEFTNSPFSLIYLIPKPMNPSMRIPTLRAQPVMEVLLMYLRKPMLMLASY